jgi:hypothetical protein
LLARGPESHAHWMMKRHLVQFIIEDIEIVSSFIVHEDDFNYE